MFLTDPNLDIVLRSVVLSLVGILWVILLVRVVGLRSFSKMTNFDFVMTIAIGSLLAGAGMADTWGAFVQSLIAMAALFATQYAAARIRKSSDTAESIMQNEPILLMRDGKIDHDAMKAERVAVSDLMAKLREANAIDISKVHAVILETTGDVSVLHGEDVLDDRLLDGVRSC